MARGTHALGGQYRGRIGGKTLYVRNGQQIVYERARGSRTPVDTRHQLPNLAIILAQRWKAQLADDGVNVELSVLLDWAYSVLKAPVEGDVDVADSRIGAWSASKVVISGSNVTCQLRSPNAAAGAEYRQPWGRAFLHERNWPVSYVIDRTLNVYPRGCRFISVIGRDVDSGQLKIGRRVDYEGGAGQRHAFWSLEQWYGVMENGVYQWFNSTDLDLAKCAYKISDWAPPGLMVENGVVLAWAIIKEDGVPIEMHTRFVTT